MANSRLQLLISFCAGNLIPSGCLDQVVAACVYHAGLADHRVVPGLSNDVTFKNRGKIQSLIFKKEKQRGLKFFRFHFDSCARCFCFISRTGVTKNKSKKIMKIKAAIDKSQARAVNIYSGCLRK